MGYYSGKQYLINSEQLEKNNNLTIYKLFDKYIGIIRIICIQYEHFF